MGVEYTHQNQGPHGHGEQNESDQGQSCIPQLVVLRTWTPEKKRFLGHNDKKKKDKKQMTVSEFQNLLPVIL